MTDDTAPTWIVVPLAARLVRARCRREEDVSILRRIPVALPVITDGEAPICARLGDGDGLRAGEWAYIPYGKGLDWIRHDGETFWRPLVGFHSRAHLSLADLDVCFAQVREHDHSDWPDWPFGIALKAFSNRKTPVLEFDGMTVRYLHTDLDAGALTEATRIAGRYALIDGLLHVRCDEPVNEVRAIGLSGRKITEVVVVPKAACDAPTRAFGRGECLQVFRADAAGDALAYAAEMAETLRVPCRVSRAFRASAGPFVRDDAAVLPFEAHERFVERTKALVGTFPRAVVEAWLDVRDAGGDGEKLRDRMAALFNLLLDGHRTSRMTILAWFEVHRLLPGVYGREEESDGEGIAAEDIAAFANFD